jgi:hypothetical protein
MQRQPDHPGSGNQRIHGLPGGKQLVEEGVEAARIGEAAAVAEAPFSMGFR